MLSVQVATQSSWPERPTPNSREWQRGLDAFGIPYMVCDPGAEMELSPAALALLGRDAGRAAVCAQAEQLAAQALATAGAGPSIGLPRQARSVPACGLEHLSLSMHVMSGRADSPRIVFVLGPLPTPSKSCAAYGFTGRETEAAHLIARGLANKDIAVALGISGHTTRRHTERVFAKLGVHTRAAVAAIMAHHVIGEASHA